MPKMKIFDGERWIPLDAQDAETLGGKLPEDYAPSSHIGTGGKSHAEATEETEGFLNPYDKKKLNKLHVGDGESGSVAILDKNGRVADSEKVGGKTLEQLDLRYSIDITEATYTSFFTNQTEIPINVTDYNADLDIIQVYQDGIKLVEGKNFTLDNVKKSINLIEYSADWGSEFTFAVYRGIDSKKN